MSRLRLGLVLDEAFEDPKRWTCVCTPALIEGLRNRFNCRIIQNRRDYEEAVGEIDALWSMEPGWGAPLLEFARTPALQERLRHVVSFVINSDPHDKCWRQSYFLGSGLDYFAAYYYHPTLYHMGRLRPEQFYFFPWAVPDEMVSGGEIVARGQDKIRCFGAGAHEAYATRNWCKGFPFVAASANSGCENAVMTNAEYVRWLAEQDAVIAAGSDDPKYRLTTPKYFEIAAAGALLFAQETDDLPLLGFQHMVNCVVFHRGSFETLARDYLAHPQEYLDVRRAGRELARKKHTLSARLDELERHIFLALDAKEAGRAAPTRVVVPEAAAPKAARARRKPRVLFIVDAPNWAHDLKTDNIARVLGGDYDIVKRFHDGVTADDLDAADLILVYYWLQFGGMPHLAEAFERNRHKLMVGICSNFEMQGERREGALALFGRLARAVFVNNLMQYKEFQRLLKVPVFYTPNGVDTAYYSPSTERTSGAGRLRVGWAGSLTNHGNKRGYHDLIVPACAAVEGVELVTAAREDKWRGSAEMREFYQSLDVYICASSEEGTPNPCLEAAACGVPLVTTRVGNMPELVVHGVNGLFIERETGDIAEKLALLLHNTGLREEMGRRMLDSIRAWDWRAQAENYRTLFESVLAMNGYDEGDVPVFSSAAHLYLASADRMDNVLANVSTVETVAPPQVDTYATVIGGMSGLNYLLRLEPREVVFYDINATAVEYARLVVEMIALCETPEEFVGRFFGRPLDALGAERLTVENQERYLAVPVDKACLAGTLAALSPEARETWEKYVAPHLAGRTIEGTLNCRRLLPCWPVDRRVPVGAGEATGDDGTGTGRRLPNTNAFFYGHGWLENQRNYRHVRGTLARATVRFAPFDLLREDLRCLVDPARTVALHVSNIDDWFPKEYHRRRAEWEAQVLASGGELTVITSHNGVSTTHADPHERACHAIAPHVFGKVVEVTHKVPWGFHEFTPENVRFDDYLRRPRPADTTLVHILVGEGLTRETLVDVYRKALAASRRVIVLEHNADSLDWTAEQRGRFLNAGELRALLHDAAGDLPMHLTACHAAAGERDRARNLVAVIDTAGPMLDISPAVEDAIRLGVEAAGRRDWTRALEFYRQAMSLAPDTPGLAEGIRRLSQLADEVPAKPLARTNPTGRPAISFCIITNGARPKTLAATIRSIRMQDIPGAEIIVAGKHRDEEGILYAPAEAAAMEGRLGVLRNLAAEKARGDWLVILDDDILLGEDWYAAFAGFAAECEIATSRVLLPDGTRYWDYATHGGPRGHGLLAENEAPDEYVYMSGGCAWGIRRDAAQKVRWRGELGFYQQEDVRYSEACRRLGFRIAHNPRAVAWHDAPRYTRVGRRIFTRQEGLDHRWVLEAQALREADSLLLLAESHCAANRTAETADCLRAGAHVHSAEPRFASYWRSLQDCNGGDPGGDCWALEGAPDYLALKESLRRHEARTLAGPAAAR